MEKPNVSICIPTFNDATTITATIDSTLAQTYGDFELLIVDGGSTDKTLSIVENYDDPRVTLRKVARTSRAQHWTEAVTATTGKYVKLLLPADTLKPACLERQVAAFEMPGNEGVALTATRRTIVDSDGNILMQSRGLGGMKGRVTGNDVMRRTVRSGTNPLGEPAAVLVRGETFRSSMPWNDELDYMIDIDMWITVLQQGSLFAIPETLVTLHIPNEATEANPASSQRSQAVKFMNTLHDRYPSVISSADVKLGATQAALLAQGRRAAHWYASRNK